MENADIYNQIHQLENQLAVNEKKRDEFIKIQHDKAIALTAKYSVPYISKMLNTPSSTVYSWLYRGRLEGSCLRGHWRVTEKALQQFLGAKHGVR